MIQKLYNSNECTNCLNTCSNNNNYSNNNYCSDNYYCSDFDNNNNYLVDLRVEKIDDPVGLDTKLKKFAGVVETGLFYNIADIVIAGIGNKVEVINKKKRDQT